MLYFLYKKIASEPAPVIFLDVRYAALCVRFASVVCFVKVETANNAPQEAQHSILVVG